ncbi:MAG: Gfo/Idh/MocA family oxidoreductase [Micromonosporaceae bacterium]|nr:Gfo/Idh/MocA family oxidoreductase [Micromonosporaceae bacterium]
MRIGLVGVGQQSREHLAPALLGLDTARITAITDPDRHTRNRLADRIGVPARFDSVEAMLAEGVIDGVVAACPPQAHEMIIDACLSAGLPVFIEKPPAVTTDALTQLVKKATDAGIPTAVGMNFRWAAPVMRLAELLANGRYGTASVIEIRHMAGKPRTGLWGLGLWESFLLAQVIHPVDLLLTLAASPVQQVRATSRLATDGGVLTSAHLDFDNGTVGTLLASTQAPRFEHRIEVTTSTGATLRLTGLADLTITGAPGAARDETRRWHPSPMDAGFHRTGFQGELLGFCDAVTTGSGFRPSLADLMPTYHVMDQLATPRRQQ